MNRAIVLSLLSFSSCAILGLGGVRVPTSVGGAVNSASHGAAKAAQAIDIKKRWDECQSFSTNTVALPEEFSIGSAIAMGMATKTNSPVFIEISPELKDLATVNPAQFANKKPSIGVGPKTNLHTYLAALGKQLAATSSRPTLEWTFIVLQNDAPNAFSAPGGYVFVTTGLLKKVTNEAQLAGVLAHEIGHVVEKHALKPYQRAKANACISAKIKRQDLTVLYDIPLVGDAARTANNTMREIEYGGELVKVMSGGAFNPNALSKKFITDVVNDSVQFVGNGLDSADEIAADTIAADIMIFNHYDTAEYEKLLASLPEGGWFSPHPKNDVRVAAVSKARTESAAFATSGKAPAMPKVVAEALK